MHKIKQILINIWNYLYDPKKTFSYYYKKAWKLFLDSMCVFVVFTLIFWYSDLPDDSLKRYIYWQVQPSWILIFWASVFYLFLATLNFKNNVENIYLRYFFKISIISLTGVIGFFTMFSVGLATVCGLGIDCM